MPVVGGIVSHWDGWYVWSEGIPDIGPYSTRDEALAAQTIEVDKRNKATSLAEVESFREARNCNVSYFAYWQSGAKASPGNWSLSADCNRIVTWVGDTLATVVWSGAPYRGGFDSVRVNFTARGIDGRLWHGTYYKSSGSYVRMRPAKGKSHAR